MANKNPAGTASQEEGAPWWRFPMVWFALAGPAIVVVAGIVTMVLAYRHADVALIEAPTATSLRADARAVAPALQGRNHAATPGRP
jgi:uncharacterized protein